MPQPTLPPGSADQLRRHGAIVLRGAVDPGPLSAEVVACLADGVPADSAPRSSPTGNAFHYVPLMSRRSPVSLSLVAELGRLAAELLGRAALPVRAKGTRYQGSTRWHRDADGEVTSLAVMAYLDPLDGPSGALRVLPGSHRPPLRAAPPGLPGDDGEAGRTLATRPGDLVVMDEHLLHASVGGGERRQWRVDFIADPRGPAEEAAVAAYLAGIFQVGWDGGYDVERYPTYGPDWLASGQPGVARLAELGAYRLAAAEEAAVSRPSRP